MIPAMTPTHKGKRSALISMLAATVLTGTAFGQHQVTDGEFTIDPDSIEAMDLMSRRNREAIHPGDPLDIVGLGQADNDFREGLHAAKRGSYLPAQVDEKEVYERQIAMYDSNQRFDSPLRTVDSPGTEDSGRSPTATEEAAPDAKPYDTAWIGMLLAALASIGAFMARGRGTPAP